MFGAGGLPLINHQTVFWLAQYAVTIVILVIASTQLPKSSALSFRSSVLRYAAVYSNRCSH